MTVAVPAEARLGEGPAWLGGDLLWVDLLAGRLHRSDPRDGTDRVSDYGGVLGAAVPVAEAEPGDADPLFAAVTGDGYAVLGNGAATVLATVTAEPDRRMNDGKCDPRGRFWAGSTTFDCRPGGGGLHVWERGRGVRRELAGLTLPNGLGWSLDGTSFYLIDSMVGTLTRYPYDLDEGRLSGPGRVVATFPASSGLPDGLAVDAEDCLWVAFFDGWCLRRLAPDGRLLAEVPLPVRYPTSCAFGAGTDLYVTTARDRLSEVELVDQPMAGSVLVLDAGVGGAPVGRCVL